MSAATVHRLERAPNNHRGPFSRIIANTPASLPGGGPYEEQIQALDNVVDDLERCAAKLARLCGIVEATSLWRPATHSPLLRAQPPVW